MSKKFSVKYSFGIDNNQLFLVFSETVVINKPDKFEFGFLSDAEEALITVKKKYQGVFAREVSIIH